MNKTLKTQKERDVYMAGQEWGIGIGYTLATNKCYTTFGQFHWYAEQLLERSILTHEFASKELWKELRKKYESTSQIIHQSWKVF